MRKEVIKSNTASAIKAVMAVADAIKEAKEIPAGHLYAALMSHGCSLQTFKSIIDILTSTKNDVEPLVVWKGNMLIWNVKETE